jgi:2-polyprenyl-6-methoxyphenol hydroxylase-like FAD-dependent oxidoreductase
LLGRFDVGRGSVLIDRGVYWQCGLIIAKGGFEALKAAGLEPFRDVVARLSDFDRGRMAEVADWDQVKLLSVRVDRLPRWHRPGLLCIGDAAHAMSPIGGVGINLAVQDAVAAANLLAEPLRGGAVEDSVLARVQKRRDWPTRATQRFQVTVQDYLARNVLGRHGRPKAPWPLRLMARFPVLARLPARMIGMGFRPEHIHTPERAARGTH